jgi:hypothetical protein
MACSVLQLDKDAMQARSEPSTAPHFARGDKVSIVTKCLFLRVQPNMKMRDGQLGPFTVEEHIGKNNYILKLPATIRLHPGFHVSNLRPCSKSSLQPTIIVTVPEGDKRGVRRLSRLCCVHQVIIWMARQIFALHDALP